MYSLLCDDPFSNVNSCTFILFKNEISVAFSKKETKTIYCQMGDIIEASDVVLEFFKEGVPVPFS